jgi:putative addiction module component (TIGR02574 family)
MSFTDVLETLSELTVEERHVLIARALELDGGLGLSDKDLALVEARLSDHHADPATSLPVAEIMARVRVRFPE